jgi:hypothetical protein
MRDGLSPLIEQSTETINGIPQIAYQLRLDGRKSPLLTDLDLIAMLNRCREPSWLENIELRAKEAIKYENIDQEYSHI